MKDLEEEGVAREVSCRPGWGCLRPLNTKLVDISVSVFDNVFLILIVIVFVVHV